MPKPGMRLRVTVSERIDSKGQLKGCVFYPPGDPAALYPNARPSGLLSDHVLDISVGRNTDWTPCDGKSAGHVATEIPAAESRSAAGETWCASVASFPLLFTIDGSPKSPTGVTLSLQLDPDDRPGSPQYLEPLASDGTIASAISRVVKKDADLPAWQVRILKRPTADMPRHIRVLAIFADGTYAQANLDIQLDKSVPQSMADFPNRDIPMGIAMGTIGQADGIAITNGSQQVDFNVNPNGLASGNFNYGQYQIVQKGASMADVNDEVKRSLDPSFDMMIAENNISWTYLFDRPSIQVDEHWWGTTFMFGQFIFDWLTGGLYSEAQSALKFGPAQIDLKADVGVHFQLRDQDPLSVAAQGWGVGFDVQLSAGASLHLFRVDDSDTGSSALGAFSSISTTRCADTKTGGDVISIHTVATSGCLAQLTPTGLAIALRGIADHNPWVIPGRDFLAQWLVSKDPANASTYMKTLGVGK
jgi:hypothetical protein